MSETTARLQRKLASAGDLQSVVRSMKAVAASNIGQYEKAVAVLDDYYQTVQQGLGVCFRHNAASLAKTGGAVAQGPVGAVIFGSDQGLVGRFNDVIVDFAVQALANSPGKKLIWAVGDRVASRLTDDGIAPLAVFAVPRSITSITPLIGRILADAPWADGKIITLHLYYHRLDKGSTYQPVTQRLLPLDETWRRGVIALPWPGATLPEIIGSTAKTLRALVREYLFVSLFRAAAFSLASENASRLAAMQRADRNIADMVETLTGQFHQLRQSGIDEELFDVVSGFDALTHS